MPPSAARSCHHQRLVDNLVERGDILGDPVDQRTRPGRASSPDAGPPARPGRARPRRTQLPPGLPGLPRRSFLALRGEGGDEGVPGELAEQLPGAAEARQWHRHRGQGAQPAHSKALAGGCRAPRSPTGTRRQGPGPRQLVLLHELPPDVPAHLVIGPALRPGFGGRPPGPAAGGPPRARFPRPWTTSRRKSRNCSRARAARMSRTPRALVSSRPQGLSTAPATMSRAWWPWTGSAGFHSDRMPRASRYWDARS